MVLKNTDKPVGFAIPGAVFDKIWYVQPFKAWKVPVSGNIGWKNTFNRWVIIVSADRGGVEGCGEESGGTSQLLKKGEKSDRHFLLYEFLLKKGWEIF